MKPTPYQRIMAAAKEGRGVRLSALEVAQMSCDDAIVQVASNDDVDGSGYGDDSEDIVQ
ncbi:MAG: hypothetical protein RIR41_1194 [Pseudomonadota bacterium]|jgi:hypothetical protein